MIELTAPALFAAGLASSPHCSLMCGPLQALQLRGRTPGNILALNAWRVAGYAILGAVAGAAGQRLLVDLPGPGAGTAIQLAAAGVLMVAGLLRLRRTPPPCAAGAATRCTPSRSPGPWLRGLAWAAVPCALLYAMLGLAAFSGGATAGAVLLAAFGLGTVPLTAGSGALLARLRGAGGAKLGRAAGISMIALALASASLTLSAAHGATTWCAPMFR